MIDWFKTESKKTVKQTRESESGVELNNYANFSHISKI